MEIYLPTLEAKIMALVVALRFIAFAIMVTGFVLAVGSGRLSGVSLFRPLFKAIVIVAALSTMDLWFKSTEGVFTTIAEYIDPGYNEHPTAAANTVRESTTANPEGKSWSWRRLNESVYQAVSQAIANVFIYVGTLITVPMLILQYILRWLLYLVAPFALAIAMLPGFGAITVRFFQQLLAILAWPIGFALTNLVALAVWTDFRSAVGADPTSVGDALYSPLLTAMGGILATIIIIVGMVSTPAVMQSLFAQGVAFTGQSVNVAHMVSMGSRTIHGFGFGRSSRIPPGPNPAPAAPSASLPPAVPGMRPGI
jgi:hypothetical protein